MGAALLLAAAVSGLRAQPVPSAAAIGSGTSTTLAAAAITAGPVVVGTVDMSLLFSFHPAMIDFVREEQTFSPPVTDAVTSMERQVMLRQRVGRLHLLQQHLESMAGQLQKQDVALDSAKRQAMTRLEDQRVKVEATHATRVAAHPDQRAAADVDREKQLIALETSYWEEIQKVQEGHPGEEKTTHPTHVLRDRLSLMSTMERNLRLDGMLRDIRAAVAHVRDKFGLAVVLNSGYLPARRPSPAVRPDWPTYPQNHVLTPNHYADFVATLSTERAAVQREALLHAWLDDSSATRSLMSRTGLDRMFLGGTRDVTVHALTFILNARGVPLEKQSTLVRFVQSIVEPEGRAP